MNEAIERILFSEEELKERVKQVGKEISCDYEGKVPLLVGILKGSIIFMADLMRAIDIECRITFLSASSYKNQAHSSGNVEITSILDENTQGRHIILIEDILDTGTTLSAVFAKIKETDPASVKICTLLDKKVQRSTDLKADYKCFDVENEFVVGYGLDYAQRFRNLPYIGVLKPEIYNK